MSIHAIACAASDLCNAGVAGLAHISAQQVGMMPNYQAYRLLEIASKPAHSSSAADLRRYEIWSMLGDIASLRSEPVTLIEPAPEAAARCREKPESR